MSLTGVEAGPDAEVLSLIYELLDAHADTTDLGGGLPADLGWQIHLDYLRALQRRTREILARWSAAAERTGPK